MVKYYMRRQSLEQATRQIKGGATGLAASYMKIMPSKNSSPCTSYVPGIVTMETGRDVDDRGGCPFHKMTGVGCQ